MMSGRIAALVGPKKVEIKTFPLPNPAAGALVLRVRRANVCGSDVHQYHYESEALRDAGLGHEFVGEVVALGEGVDSDFAGEPVAVGDRVVPVYFLTCHRCARCLRGEFNLCVRGLDSWVVKPEVAPHFRSAFGTHYYVQPGQYFYKVPDDVDDATAAGANCGLAQMIFVLDRLGVAAGETLVIQGAGGLGLYAAAVAQERGVRVIIIDGLEERLRLARRFGATETINLSVHRDVADRVELVGQMTSAQGADAVLEVAGVPDAFGEAIHLARVGGRIASVGNLNAESQIQVTPGVLTRKNLTVMGLLRYNPEYLHRAIKFLARRQTFHPFDTLPDRSYGLDDVEAALIAGEQRSVARVAIVP